jgi:acetyl esterase/lipase
MRTNIRRRTMLTAGMAFFASTVGRTVGGQAPAPGDHQPPPSSAPKAQLSFEIWPKGAPGMPADPPAETMWDRSTNPLIADRAVRGITRPRLDVFRPDRPNGAAVLLFPGGGYQRVVVDREGYEMASWLAARGFTAFVLFYRLPGEGWAAGADVALSDAQRAARLIRQRAGEFGLVPARLAIMGFSAGGHLCADLAARFAVRTYDAIDQADTLSARPYCAAPIYPVVSMRAGIAHVGSRKLLIGPDANEAQEIAHSPDRNIPDDAPPHFIVHAEDDASVPVENALLLRAALKAKGASVETHLFRSGGHGFGLRRAIGKPVAAWPDLWRAWADSVGLA